MAELDRITLTGAETLRMCEDTRQQTPTRTKRSKRAGDDGQESVGKKVCVVLQSRAKVELLLRPVPEGCSRG